VEVRHLKIFSQKTKDELVSMATIMEDKIMVQNLDENNNNQINTNDGDILEAIVKEGMSEDTEKLVKSIHNIQKTGLKHEKANFKAEMGMAMAGSADGLKLTRAAFSIMIKFSDLTDDL
jgi:hypothetical protein